MVGVSVNEGNIRSLIVRKFPEATLLSAYTEAMFMSLNSTTASSESSNPVSMDSLRLPLDTLLEALRRALLKQEFFAQAKGEPTAPPASIALMGKIGNGDWR